MSTVKLTYNSKNGNDIIMTSEQFSSENDAIRWRNWLQYLLKELHKNGVDSNMDVTLENTLQRPHTSQGLQRKHTTQSLQRLQRLQRPHTTHGFSCKSLRRSNRTNHSNGFYKE